MKRTVALVLVVLLLGAFVAVAQESEEREQVLTVDIGLPYPSYLGLGMYWPNNMFELPGGILSGIEMSFAYGSQFNTPSTFADQTQDELTEYNYYKYPDAGLETMGRGWGIRTLLTVYELELGFGTLPIKTGPYIGGGGISGPADATYMTLDFGWANRVEVRLSSFNLLKPYVELGLGFGEASPIGDEAREEISGLTANAVIGLPSSDDNYKKYYSSRWRYTTVLLNVGARLEIPVFWGKSKPAEEEAEAEPEPEVDTRVSEFLFPEWFMDLGGLAHFPDGRGNPMAGSIIIGPQKLFRNFSFKHQSSYKPNTFNHKYDPEAIVEIVQSDNTMWHAKLRTESGEVMEYKIYRLQAGVPVTIDGTEITPDEDGVYYDGMEFHTIAPTS